jgi:hypothetical protein
MSYINIQRDERNDLDSFFGNDFTKKRIKRYESNDLIEDWRRKTDWSRKIFITFYEKTSVARHGNIPL